MSDLSNLLCFIPYFELYVIANIVNSAQDPHLQYLYSCYLHEPNENLYSTLKSSSKRCLTSLRHGSSYCFAASY